MAESNLQFSSQNSVNETLARLHVNTAAVVEIRFLRGFRNSTESSRKASKIPTDLRREIKSAECFLNLAENGGKLAERESN